MPHDPNTDYSDRESVHAVSLKGTLDTLRPQRGFRSFEFGVQIENPDKAEGFLLWDSFHDHMAWREHPEHTALVERMGSTIEEDQAFYDSGGIYHVDFEPFEDLAKAIAAPVTEVARFYFDDGPPADYMDGFLKVLEILKKEPGEGLHAAVAGVTYEELEYEGVKGKVVILVVGWQSVDAHKAFKETQTFKDIIGPLRSSAKTYEAHHTKFMDLSAW